jgi:hypothetical protein
LGRGEWEKGRRGEGENGRLSDLGTERITAGLTRQRQ